MATIDYKFNINPEKVKFSDTSYSTESFVKSLKVDMKSHAVIKKIDYNKYESSYPSITIKEDFEKGSYTHSNLLQYIAIAYANEHGIILRPDMFHYTILSEITKYIFDNVEQFRPIFTDSTGKKDIQIVSPNPEDFIEKLDSSLDSVILDKNFKNLYTSVRFESEPDNYDLVKKIMFAHSATPYYNYYRSKCGFPIIKVVDNKNDWLKLVEFIDSMSDLMLKYNANNIAEYLVKCKSHIENIINISFNQSFYSKLLNLVKLSDGQYLQQIFMVNKDPYYKCRSGHDIEFELSGWIIDFYLNGDEYKTIDSFPSHLPYLPYIDEVGEIKNYVIVSGLVNSKLVDNVLIPSYEKIKYEITNKELFDIIRKN